MTKKLFGAASLVAFILFGASCANQEQSEFNMDSVKQEVTISAKVTYDAGVEADASNPNGYKIVNAKPAVNRKVFVEIPFTQYSGAAAAGRKIFETVTDENGVFTITVPTKSTGVNADIRLEEFTAMYQEYVKMGADGKPIFKSKLYSYDTPAGLTNINLKPGAFKFPDNNDISYTMHALDMEDFDETVTIAGSINLAYETGFREGAFKSANNANVEFEIAYVGMVNPLKFGTTTDANGNYKIVLPMRSLSEGFTINSIKVLGIGDNEFKHWISDTIAQPEIIKGAYELAGITAAPIAFADVIDGITYDLGAKNLIFTPYYNAGITNIPEPENWSKDLIGWSAGRGDLGFNETYDKTAKLTGKVYMPYLKAYGEAAYKSEKQTIILTGTAAPYNQGLVVITEEDGSFSVDLPVKDENPINFTVKLEKEDQPFEFKGSKKNVVLYDGKYNSNVKIKEEGTEWYELGSFFFKYAPDAGNTPAEWNADLIGWYRDPVYKKINPDKTIKGQFLFSVEESYGIGKYEPLPFIVTISIDDDNNPGTPNRSIAIKPDANGKISFDLPLKDELDQPDITVSTANFPSNEYVHYTEFGKTDSRLVSDKYTLYKYVYDKKDPEWNEKIGTRYYKFAQATDEGDLPSTFHKNLAGWFIMCDGTDHTPYQASVKASGKAKLAYETGFLSGDWKAAQGQVVNVTVDGSDVEILTDQQGNFKLDVPIKKEGFKATLGVSTTKKIKVDNFKHYVDASSTQLLSGEYSGESVTEDDAEWNEFGTVYYTFTPIAAEKPAIWDKYCKFIAGWTIYEADWQTDITITAKVMRAVEKWLDPAKAVWEDEGNNTATVTINGTEAYPVPVKGGEITLTLKRKEAPANIQLTIKPDDYKIASFNHWKTKSQENSLITVKNYKYTSAGNIASTVCTKEEGNIYKPAHAAKMILYINALEGYDAPENWGSYSWNVNNDDKD
jgi:hypothetical protein